MTRIPLRAAALCVAAAFLVGYGGRLAWALVVGVRPPAASRARPHEAPGPQRETSHAAAGVDPLVGAAPTTSADRGECAMPAANRATDAVVRESTAGAASNATQSTSADGASCGPVAVVPLGHDASSARGPFTESFEDAIARHSARNAAHATTLADARFRFVAYRSRDRFEISLGDLARHYRASPSTWLLVLAAQQGKRLPADPPTSEPPPDSDTLTAAQCVALRGAIDEYLRGCEAVRRDLWTSMHDGVAAAAAPALDPRSVSAVFAGEHGVAVIPAGADAELDRLLDELARAETTVRSDVEFILQ